MLYKWFTRIYHTIVFLISLGFFIHIFAPILVEASPMTNVFINEIHYDNSGADINEFIEIAGVKDTNLLGWTLHLYNGSNGTVYDSHTFSNWLLTDVSNGYGFAAVTIPGIQNGSPDGIALSNKEGSLIQFLSYEGSFIATSGIADGILSTDIGVEESTSTEVGLSLQLSGTGSVYKDFTWSSPKVNSFGNINADQSFIDVVTVNEPSSILLISLACLLFVNRYKRIS